MHAFTNVNIKNLELWCRIFPCFLIVSILRLETHPSPCQCSTSFPFLRFHPIFPPPLVTPRFRGPWNHFTIFILSHGCLFQRPSTVTSSSAFVFCLKCTLGCKLSYARHCHCHPRHHTSVLQPVVMCDEWRQFHNNNNNLQHSKMHAWSVLEYNLNEKSF
jgi:hypothetical protein